jgi:two-component system cell cycle sensor histidine kinase/response regulator CckA
MQEEQDRKKLDEQLWRSQKMEAIGQLAGGIAHDLNNVLAIILGYTSLALDRITTDDPLHRNIEGIQKAAGRATTLTRHLLAFSRRQVLRPRILRLNTVVAELQKFMSRIIGEDIELLIDLDPDLAFVTADPAQIEQALVNLMINARNAMPEGGRMTVATRNIDLTADNTREYEGITPGPHVLIEITRTGNAIDTETAAHVFEPFLTRDEDGKSPGRGLAAAYGIIKESGGYLWAFSGPGRGSSFRIFLPQTNPAVEEEPAGQRREFSRGNEVVLLVEDQDELRGLLRESLQLRGYRVLEAKNGFDALSVAENYGGRIHVAVTDIVMPMMSGRSLAQNLFQARPETPILFMSGYPHDAANPREAVSPDVDFLQKPFEPAKLADKIRELLDKGNGLMIAV